MARTITDEQIKLSIIINGNPAQKQLMDLEKSTRELNKTTVQQNIELKQLEKSLGKQSNEYKALSATIKANNQTITDNKATMKELQNQIGLTGLTMSQLKQKATILRLELANMIPGSADFNRIQGELTAVGNRMNEVSGRARQSGTSIGSIADGFNRYAALGASVVAGLTGVVVSIQSIIDLNGKLSDSQADVMKTTGMSKKEVDQLTESFGMLQTRTSRIDLLKIAESGGRIGIAKEEIGGFVDVMNKASVALGDSFTGGAEEVADKLGKLKFLFKETQDLNVDQAYNSIGSAINDLGANGSATEANIADFTTRIGSLADKLKPTIAETLALGAAFEESGIESEVSSRAYNIFMKQASTESGKFAKVMGISKQKVEDFINTNPLEFMLNFAQGMKGMDATETAKTLDYLGINADGANKAIGAMANNTNRFRELIDLSNNSFADGSSLITEYDIKNNNLAATLEKLKKTVSGWFSSQGFTEFLLKCVNLFARLVGSTEETNDKTQVFKNTIVFTAKMLAVVTAALVTNAGWQKLVAMWTTRNTEATVFYNIALKARAFAESVAMVASQAYAGVTMLLSGNLRGATQAFRVMTAAMATTPWGFILAAISAVVVAYKMFSAEAEKVATKQSILKNIQVEAAGAVNAEKNALKDLLAIANNEFESKKNRLAAIKKINQISPEYLGNLTLENIKTAEAKKSIDNYITSLKSLAYTKALQDKLQNIQRQKVDIQTSSDDDNIGSFESFNNGFYGRGEKGRQKVINKNKAAKIKPLDDEEKNVQSLIDNDRKKNVTNYLADTPASTYNTNLSKDDKNKPVKNPNSSEEEINKLEYENWLKYQNLKNDYKRKLQDDEIAMMEEGYAKESLIEARRYEREIEEINKLRTHKDEIIKIDAEIAKAKEDKDIKKYDALILIKKEWGNKNAELDKQIQDIAENKLSIHKIKIAAIDIKGNEIALKQEKEQHDRQKSLNETAFNEQYLLLGNDEIAKENLKKKFKIDEIENDKIFLQKQLQNLKDTINGKNGQVDFSNLSKEQRQKIIDAFELTKAQLSKLGLDLDDILNNKNKKNEILTGTGTDIFGFTPGQWEDAFKKLEQLGNVNLTLEQKLRNAAAAFEVLGTGVSNVMTMANQFAANNDQQELKQLDKTNALKKQKLDRKLKLGLISQAQYDKQVKKLEDEKERKSAELEYNKAKRERIAALFSIAINTGIGISKAYAMSPQTFGAPWSIVLAAMGAIQAGLILSQPLPAKGYEQGLYPQTIKREQDGKLFNASFGGETRSGMVSKPTYFLTGENGPEMIIDSRSYRSLSPAIRSALANELRGIKGFEQGLYNQQALLFKNNNSGTQTSTTVSSTSNDDLMKMMIAVMQQNTDAINKLSADGVYAKVLANDYKSMKELTEGLKTYTSITDKQKR